MKLRGCTDGKVAWVKEEGVDVQESDSGEVEDVCHWLLQCSAWNHLRQPLPEAMDNVGKDFSTRDNGDRTALTITCM